MKKQLSTNLLIIHVTGNFRVVAYSRSGDFLGVVVSETWNFGIDVKPTHLAALQDGRLLVAMQGRGYCRIHVYTKIHREKEDQGQWFEGEGCLAVIAACFCLTDRNSYEKL